MDEKQIEKTEEQPIVVKKVYTPPALTVYGKLAELTEGSGGSKNENFPGPSDTKRKP